MNTYLPGEKIKIQGIDLLVLDIIDGYPFVLAYDIENESVFSTTSNFYVGSELEKAMDKWDKEVNLPIFSREVDLTYMDGYKVSNLYCRVAPLTFDEYRKYSNIIIPNLTHGFFTCTAWSRPVIDLYAVCFVHSRGGVYWNSYAYTYRIAPAFILDTNRIPKDVYKLSTKALIEELYARIVKEN